MNDFYKLSSIFSFIGAAAFILLVIETGKLVFLAFSFVMLCNGINLWTQDTEKKENHL